MDWYPMNGGKTLGQPGSECGAVVHDDEHGGGARITLERDCGNIPFAITCGIYGWFFHTRFMGDAAQAQDDYGAMKEALGAILATIPLEADPEARAKAIPVEEAIAKFVERFP